MHADRGSDARRPRQRRTPTTIHADNDSDSESVYSLETCTDEHNVALPWGKHVQQVVVHLLETQTGPIPPVQRLA
jgi:hypothetical protein